MKTLEDGHIADVALENYSLNHLDEPELELVEEHILICPVCQERLQELDEFIRALRMAHGRNERPGTTNIVTDGWVSQSEISLHVPHVAWFQRRSIWAGLAMAMGLIVLIPTALRFGGAGEQVSEPPVVRLIAQRGALGGNESPAGRLKLELDVRGIAADPLTIEIASWNGRLVSSSVAGQSEGVVRIAPGLRFATGQYFIRVRAEGNPALLREFQLRVR